VLTNKEWIFALSPSVERHFHKLYKRESRFHYFYFFKETVLFFIKPCITDYDFSNIEGTARVDFLFFATENNHLDQQEPLYRELVKRGNSVYFLNCISKLKKRIKAISENAVSPRPLKRSLGLLSKLRFYIRFCKISREISRELSIPGGDSFRILLSFLFMSVQFENLFNTFFSKIKVNKGVVLGYDIPLIGRMMAIIAKKNGHEVTCPMHGTLSSTYKNFGCAADTLFLFGEQDFQNLRDWNLNVKLQVTGSAALDKFFLGTEDPVIFPRIKVDEQKKLVLVAGSGPGDSVSLEGHLQFISQIVELAADYQNSFYFVFKLHPKDNKKFYDKAIKYYSNVLVFSSEEANAISVNIFEWLKEVDILITGASTVGLEAQLQGIPCLSFDPQKELGSKFYVANGDTIYCIDKDQLSSFLLQFLQGKVLLDNKKKAEIERKYFYKVDGNSASRMADFLERVN
jgi:hypothetical protein